ncbi:MAG: FeoA domain-containing protein [Candidatus Omnitrophota bacterium]
MSLVHLKASHKGKVVDILGGVNLQNRLMSMGLYKGREVGKLSHIGLRGPVVIKVGRGILALGHNIAVKIIIEVV